MFMVRKDFGSDLVGFWFGGFVVGWLCWFFFLPLVSSSFLFLYRKVCRDTGQLIFFLDCVSTSGVISGYFLWS